MATLYPSPWKHCNPEPEQEKTNRLQNGLLCCWFWFIWWSQIGAGWEEPNDKKEWFVPMKHEEFNQLYCRGMNRLSTHNQCLGLSDGFRTMSVVVGEEGTWLPRAQVGRGRMKVQIFFCSRAPTLVYWVYMFTRCRMSCPTHPYYHWQILWAERNSQGQHCSISSYTDWGFYWWASSQLHMQDNESQRQTMFW